MSIGYVLRQAGRKMGLSPSVEGEREVLLRFCNEAAEELYDQADIAGSLMECCFKINGDQEIALPAFVGNVRALRELDSLIPWSINQMRPRYNVQNWKDAWRNIRLKYQSPLQASVRNESILSIVVPEVENPPVVISLTGSTTFASTASETIVMDSTVKNTVNAYKEIKSFTKDRINLFDVHLFDVDELELSVIPNDYVEASYQVIDVSICPWLNNNAGQLDHYMEVLYKKPLPWFSNDTDEYPVQKCDNILVNKILQLWAEEQEKPDVALAFDSKATRSLARKNENQNRPTQDCVAMVPNPHDYLSPRIRSRRPSRYGGYWQTGSWGVP